MPSADLSDNKTFAGLRTLADGLRTSRTPLETLNAVRVGFGEAYGDAASVLLSTAGLPDGHYRVLQMHLAGALQPLTEQTLATDSLPVFRHGLISRIVRDPQPQIHSGIDWTDDHHFRQKLAGCGSVMAIPLRGTEMPMDWILLIKRAPEVFTVAELEDTVMRTVLVSSLMNSRGLSEKLAAANERIEREMREVGQLQRALLPAPIPPVPGLGFAVSYEPSGRAGGDIYDVFPLKGRAGGADRWCILIGDASGHGIAAAVVMAIIHTVLHAYPAPPTGPAELLRHTNQQLCAKQLGGFVTMFLAIYEPASGKLVYCSAGHPPVLQKLSATATVVELSQAASFPIGIEPDQQFPEASVRLGRGDLLLLYTDGVTEARSPDNRMIETDGLRTAFAAAGSSPADIIDRLRRMIQDHQQGGGPLDDQTMVVAFADLSLPGHPPAADAGL